MEKVSRRRRRRRRPLTAVSLDLSEVVVVVALLLLVLLLLLLLLPVGGSHKDCLGEAKRSESGAAAAAAAADNTLVDGGKTRIKGGHSEARDRVAFGSVKRGRDARGIAESEKRRTRERRETRLTPNKGSHTCANQLMGQSEGGPRGHVTVSPGVDWPWTVLCQLFFGEKNAPPTDRSERVSERGAPVFGGTKQSRQVRSKKEAKFE